MIYESVPIGIYKYASMVWGPFDVNLEDDSLRKNWRSYGTKGWLYPPYSNITPWIEKALRESERGFSTLMLIPTLNGEAHDSLIIEKAATLMFIIGKDGPRGSMFAWFAPNHYKKHPSIDSVYRSDIIQWK